MKNIQSLCILGIVFSLLLTGCSNVDDKSQNKKLKEKNIVNKINKGNLKIHTLRIMEKPMRLHFLHSHLIIQKDGKLKLKKLPLLQKE